jgi:hypothetical protein
MIAGIVLVSIWMALSLLFSFFLIPFGGDAACQGAADVQACNDRFTAWWLGLLVVEFLAAVGAIILWVRPRIEAKAWGLVLGVLGTGGLALAFVGLQGIAL